MTATRPVIPHPVRGIVRIEPYQYQAEFWANDAPARVVLKARQVGYSQAIALEALHTAVFQPYSTVLIVSRNLEAAVNVLGYVKVALSTPGLGMPKLVRNQETRIAFANGSRILSIPATKGTGRTYAATAAYLDEFAHMPWAEEIYQAVSPAASRAGRLTVLSTPGGRANPFFLLWQGEWGGEFQQFVTPWWRCPAYNPGGWRLEGDEARAIGEAGEWYGRERQRYTAQQWAQEFGCDFVESGVAVFRADDIERAQALATGLEAAREGREYVTFWDIGRRQDATVGTTLDVTEMPAQVVAWERREGLPYPAIQRLIEQRFVDYPGEHWVESNGVGDPVIENLDVPVQAWLTTARSKEQMITAAQLAMEAGRLAWPVALRQVTTEMLLYQWNDKVLVQDCVMSLAGAVAVAEDTGWKLDFGWV